MVPKSDLNAIKTDAKIGIAKSRFPLARGQERFPLKVGVMGFGKSKERRKEERKEED